MFKEDYQAAFSKVTASEETKRKVLELPQSRVNSKKRPSKAACLALAAVLIALLAACAIAFDAGAMLEAAFGENGRAQYEREKWTWTERLDSDNMYIMFTTSRPGGTRSPLDTELGEKLAEPYIFEVNQTATDGKSTLTVRACLHDPITKTGILYLSLENPEGFPNLHIWNDGYINWVGEDGGFVRYLSPDTASAFYVVDALTTDTRVYMTCHYAYKGEKQEMYLSFRDTDAGVSIPLPERTDMKLLSLADGDVILTPVGLSINAARLDGNNPNIKILYQDGTEDTVSWADWGAKNIRDRVENYALCYEYTDGTAQMQSYALKFFVDIENVKSVVINDEEFFVE